MNNTMHDTGKPEKYDHALPTKSAPEKRAKKTYDKGSVETNVAALSEVNSYLPQFAERLTQFRMHTGLGINEFGALCGISGGQISKLFHAKANISIHKVRAIFAAFPDLDPGWLITGHGQMLRSLPPKKPYQLAEGEDPLHAMRNMIMQAPLDGHIRHDLIAMTNFVEQKMNDYKDELLAQHAEYTRLTNTLIDQLKRNA